MKRIRREKMERNRGENGLSLRFRFCFQNANVMLTKMEKWILKKFQGSY